MVEGVDDDDGDDDMKMMMVMEKDANQKCALDFQRA